MRQNLRGPIKRVFVFHFPQCLGWLQSTVYTKTTAIRFRDQSISFVIANNNPDFPARVIDLPPLFGLRTQIIRIKETGWPFLWGGGGNTAEIGKGTT